MNQLDVTVARERDGSSSAGPEVTMTLERDVEPLDEPEPRAPDPTSRRRRIPLWLRAGAPAWTWIGMLIAAAGFGLIALGWGGVAGETQVYRQIPYVVSAGLVGLGMVVVGLTVLNVASRQQDAIARDHQMEQLIDTMEQLRETLAERQDDEQ